MANTFAVSRNHLIFGLCLPLAVLLGYLLAEPLDAGTLTTFVALAGVLSLPLLMRWHHFLLVLSWNAAIYPVFLPGRPALWMVMVFASFLFAIVGRSVRHDKRLLQVPALTWSLLCLLAVVVVTALITGGVGIKAFGSRSYGGKGYFIIGAAVLGYFALSSQAIPRERAPLYVGLFFLSGLTAVVSNLAFYLGPKFFFLYQLFPTDLAMGQIWADAAFQSDLVRITGLVLASQALYGFLLARYGIKELLRFDRPWRLALLAGSVIISLYGGFRTGLIMFGLTFGALMCVERLWKTRTMWVVAMLTVSAAVVAAAVVDRMPMSVQRALSFLPLKIDPAIKAAAEDSTEWRLYIWRTLWPEVPHYLFKGKGYALDRRELVLVADASMQGYSNSNELALYAGDYHNGPLSVVIPFGLYGVAAFLWFIGAALRVLYHNYRFGDPALRSVNAFLFAFFIARVIFFFFIFGTFFGELFYFTGLVGLSVALNRGEAQGVPAVAVRRGFRVDVRRSYC